jgi:AraC-like DNA-binding protein
VIDWQGLRDTTGASILIKTGLEFGMSLAECLVGTTIDPASLDEPFASIPSWQELALIRNIQGFRSSDEELGLMVARHYNASAMGVLGQAMAACETLEKALQLTERYRWFGLSFSRYELKSTELELRIVVNDRAVPEDCQRFCQERGLAACISLFSSLLLSPVSVRSVSMRSPRPINASVYNEYFGTDVCFSAPSNQVSFDTNLQYQALPQANRKIRLASERYCDEVLAKHERSQTFAGRTIGLIEERGLSVNFEQIAHSLTISSRQLRRKLSKEGTSFRELLLSSKMERAQSLLKRGISVEEIARQLGYAETASFSRAFKTRLGVSPKRFF